MRRFDVIVVGGGPAGLSAALYLGRSRRSVALCDSGEPRNKASAAMHGYLTRDGTPPLEFLEKARAELEPYRVTIILQEVVDASRDRGGFEARLADGRTISSRKMLLATGVMDRLPDLEGLEPLYGKSVFHCPYCDGWEVRDRALAAWGSGRAGVSLATSLTHWSPDVILCTDGKRLSGEHRRSLEERGVVVHFDPIARLEGTGGRLEGIRFRSGEQIRREALFFTSGQEQRSSLHRKLGCATNARGNVRIDRNQKTPVPGLYAVGDMSPDTQLVVVAAAEGAKAAIAINRELLAEDRVTPPE